MLEKLQLSLHDPSILEPYWIMVWDIHDSISNLISSLSIHILFLILSNTFNAYSYIFTPLVFGKPQNISS